MAELTQLETDSRIALKDGRIITFRKYGDQAGEPVFYLHGFPGSRIEARLADRVATRLGIRIIAIDRPGIGSSTFQPRRQITDLPDDLVMLADALKFKEFSVLGLSGGGPYALACAFKLGKRVKKVTLVCGLGPPNIPETNADIRGLHRFGFNLASRSPGLVHYWFSPLALMVLRRPERIIESYAQRSIPVDREILLRPEVRETLAQSWGESVRHGARGLAWELGLYSRPWGFRLEDITMPVELWQGDLDKVVPLSMGQHQARVIPNSTLNVVKGAGHFSLVIDHCEEILKGFVK